MLLVGDDGVEIDLDTSFIGYSTNQQNPSWSYSTMQIYRVKCFHGFKEKIPRLRIIYKPSTIDLVSI